PTITASSGRRSRPSRPNWRPKPDGSPLTAAALSCSSWCEAVQVGRISQDAEEAPPRGHLRTAPGAAAARGLIAGGGAKIGRRAASAAFRQPSLDVVPRGGDARDAAADDGRL